MVEIAYVVDNNPEKWGTWLGGLECVGMERLEQEKDNVLVIVCNKNSQALINDLKEKNFPYVLSKQSLDKMLEGIPKIGDFRGIDKISELDYSSEGVKQLIDLFNRTINDICNYYEAKLK